MVASWIKELTEDVFAETLGGRPLSVGETVVHPDGRTVTITSGEYWAAGGFSNFWYWREVLANGGLGPEEHGYGWRVPIEQKGRTMTVDEMVQQIEDECTPAKMTQAEALEFLQGIVEELDVRIGALRAEVGR